MQRAVSLIKMPFCKKSNFRNADRMAPKQQLKAPSMYHAFLSLPENSR